MRAAGLPHQKLKKIRAVFLDVDGILTDGRIYIGTGGDGRTVELKAFHAHDGQGLILARRLGFEIGLVTSRTSELVAIRAQELNIPHVHQGVKDKLPVVKEALSKLRLSRENLLYMGDDFPDLPVLQYAGFSVTVPDAPRELRAAADYITDLPGGSGAVREVLELLFKVQRKWKPLVDSYRSKK